MVSSEIKTFHLGGNLVELLMSTERLNSRRSMERRNTPPFREALKLRKQTTQQLQEVRETHQIYWALPPQVCPSNKDKGETDNLRQAELPEGRGDQLSFLLNSVQRMISNLLS